LPFFSPFFFYQRNILINQNAFRGFCQQLPLFLKNRIIYLSALGGIVRK
jgi:hypothetical protein